MKGGENNMRKTSFFVLFLGALMFMVAPAMAANTVYDITEEDHTDYGASAFHADTEASGIPGDDSYGYLTGSIALGPGIMSESTSNDPPVPPAYTSPCPYFIDTNGIGVGGGCAANSDADSYQMSGTHGGFSGFHAIVDDMLAKMIDSADDPANHLTQQLDILFMRDYVNPAGDRGDLFVDQTLDQDLAWATSGADDSSYLIGASMAGEVIKGRLFQRFQLINSSVTTMTSAADCAGSLTTTCMRSKPDPDGMGTALGDLGAVDIDQWVVGFVKDGDGVDGIVSSISSWFQRDDSFVDCPTIGLTTSGTGGPCSWTYDAGHDKVVKTVPEINDHP
jgi:hypothetical protein